MNPLIIKISTLVAYVVMVAVNHLAVILPLGGRTTGTISNNYPNLFAPAGYAFSIWGLIYILLGVYAVYQLRREKDVLVEKINRIFIVNTLLNASWMFAWHYDFIWLSVVLMIGLLITLIKIVNIFSTHIFTPKEKFLVRLPFSVYFGWVTVATIANITVFLVYLGWNRFGLPENVWMVMVLLIGALIGSWRMLRDRYASYGLVLVWAYGAILARHLSISGFNRQYPSVIWTVVLCLFIFLGVITFISIKKKNN